MKQLVAQNKSPQDWISTLALGELGNWKQAVMLREAPPPGRGQGASGDKKSTGVKSPGEPPQSTDVGTSPGDCVRVSGLRYLIV